MRRNKWVGFADLYLFQCQTQSKTDDDIDIQVYTELIKLDSKLGTTATNQLFNSVRYLLGLDFIKVRIPSGVVIIKSFSVDKYEEG